MPELPEVETVRRGLEPWLVGVKIEKVMLNRVGLRFPFPENLAAVLEGETVMMLGRRAKYLLMGLSCSKTLLSHLGMTGSWRFVGYNIGGGRHYSQSNISPKHDHMVWDIVHPVHGRAQLVYADPRRFGFIAIYDEIEKSPYLADLGPEPMGNDFHAGLMATKFAGRKISVKPALLDQRIVAGLGNIYVSEALYRAHILPTVPAGRLVTVSGAPGRALEDLVVAVRQVLSEAIMAGGSTLRDFRNTEGGSGYFQHDFAVYGREGEMCPNLRCAGIIKRIVQSGRSSFFCPRCQKAC